MSHLTKENNMIEIIPNVLGKNFCREHQEEIKNLIESIEHYQVQLKRPVWKYTFDKEDSHDIAKRIIAREKKQLDELLKVAQ
jgi:hypothetical protein